LLCGHLTTLLLYTGGQALSQPSNALLGCKLSALGNGGCCRGGLRRGHHLVSRLHCLQRVFVLQHGQRARVQYLLFGVTGYHVHRSGKSWVVHLRHGLALHQRF
jgi:hypothetical protein